MGTTSLCRLCGGLLKANAKRCRSCGAKVNSAQSVTTPTVSTFHTGVGSTPPQNQGDVHASPPAAAQSGDGALARKLIPLNKAKNLFLALSVFSFTPFAILFLIVFVADTLTDAQAGMLFSSLFLTGILGFAFLFISRSFTKKKKALISTYIVEELLNERFSLAHYDPLDTFSDEILASSALRRWHRSKGNDFFAATYRGVSFQFADVRLIRQSGRNSHTVFQGQWLLLDLHHEISSPLMVSSIEKKGHFPRQFRTSIPTGNAIFDKEFTVLTETPELVPKIVTEGLITFLLPKNHESIDADYPFALSPQNEYHLFFKDKRMHIAINSGRDLFEPCSNVDNIPAMRERILREIGSIQEIIDLMLGIPALFQTEDMPKTEDMI